MLSFMAHAWILTSSIVIIGSSTNAKDRIYELGSLIGGSITQANLTHNFPIPLPGQNDTCNEYFNNAKDRTYELGLGGSITQANLTHNFPIRLPGQNNTCNEYFNNVCLNMLKKAYVQKSGYYQKSDTETENEANYDTAYHIKHILSIHKDLMRRDYNIDCDDNLFKSKLTLCIHCNTDTDFSKDAPQTLLGDIHLVILFVFGILLCLLVMHESFFARKGFFQLIYQKSFNFFITLINTVAFKATYYELNNLQPKYADLNKEIIALGITANKLELTHNKAKTFRESFAMPKYTTSSDGTLNNKLFNIKTSWKKGETMSVDDLFILMLVIDYDIIKSELSKCIEQRLTHLFNLRRQLFIVINKYGSTNFGIYDQLYLPVTQQINTTGPLLATRSLAVSSILAEEKGGNTIAMISQSNLCKMFDASKLSDYNKELCLIDFAYLPVIQVKLSNNNSSSVDVKKLLKYEPRVYLFFLPLYFVTFFFIFCNIFYIL